MTEINFKKEYVLENEVVKLRPLTSDDFKVLSKFAISEPTLWQYSLLPANGLKNMQAYLNAALKDKTNEVSYPFIVYDKRKKAYAGSTRFYDYQKTHQTIQLGYTWYGKEFQGSGLNKNCKYLMLGFAFETLGLERVEFRADNNNERSIAAMKSIGCQVEGVLRSNCSSISGRRDGIVLSILKDEWFDSVKSTLKTKCAIENERYNTY
jgi:RimJ/RimL family protein N-acetyltransferase